MDLLSRLASLFATPVGAGVLALAVLAIAGISVWWLWKRDGDNSVTSVEAIPTPAAPPPVLTNSIFLGGANPAAASAAQSNLTARNLGLAFLGLVAVVVAGRVMFGQSDVAPMPDRIAEVERPRPDPKPEMAGNASIPCDQGFLDLPPNYETQLEKADKTKFEQQYRAWEPRSFRLCQEKQAAEFDLIRFSHNDNGGDALREPRWVRGPSALIKAKDVAVPFALDVENVDLRLRAGRALEDYDFFLAVGLAESGLKRENAKLWSSARGFSVARYVIERVAGDQLRSECRSDAAVYAVSAGGFSRSVGEMDATAPLLIGVKFMDGSYDIANRDAVSLVSGFMSSRGVEISGYNLRHFTPFENLFAEPICDRASL